MNVFSEEELNYLNNLPEVLTAKATLDSRASGKVYFSVNITDSIRSTLLSRFGLDLSTRSTIPMSWIKGDTAAHIDSGASKFQNTYLVYLNYSPGELIVDSQSYPIEANSGFVFNEGLSHETRSTDNVSRLLLGPMNEMAEPVGAVTTRFYIQLMLPSSNNLVIFSGFFDVEIGTNIVKSFFDSSNPTVNIISTGTNGAPSYLYEIEWLCFDGGGCNITSFPYLYGVTVGDYNLSGNPGSSTGSVDGLSNVTYKINILPVYYYRTEADALANINYLASTRYFRIGLFGGYTSWRIASNSAGSSSQSTVYISGDTLNADGFYYLYPPAPCFLEGTTILCEVDGLEKYVPVEELKKGTLVKTTLNAYKPLVLIGKGTILNPGNDERTENRLYKCSPSKYPELKDDLYITGCHSILEFPITEKQKEDTIKHHGKLFVTDNKYRLMAYVDERAQPWNSEGTYTIWHFALENTDERMNYGVYANGGLLVESCSIKMLTNKSNMKFIS